MASSGRTVEVDVRVEVVPGPATAAWLERLGWMRPVVEPDNVGLVEPVEIVPAYPTGMATDARLRLRAAQRRAQLRAELTEVGQIALDDLLRMFGADLTALPSDCDC